MKNTIFLILFLAVQNLSSQTQELKWHTDLKEAINISMTENKPLLLFFTGSDWCGWCVRLKNEVFNYDEFKKWSDKNVVLVELDFPRRKQQLENIKQQNRELASMFGVSGYPTVWLVNPQIKDSSKINLFKLGKLGYVAGGTNKWISEAEKFLSFNKNSNIQSKQESINN